MSESVRKEWVRRTVTALRSEGSRRLIEFLQGQRWFGGKASALVGVEIVDAIALSEGTDRRLLVLISTQSPGRMQEWYAVLLVIRPLRQAGDAYALMPFPASEDWICDATHDPAIWIGLYQDVAHGRERKGESGCVSGQSFQDVREKWAEQAEEVTVLSGEQTNTSVVFDRRVIFKLLRKVERGIHPDGEMLHFLTMKTAYPYVPPLLGLVTYSDLGGREAGEATLGVVQRFVPGSVDGWKYTLAHLDGLLQEAPTLLNDGCGVAQAVAEIAQSYLGEIRRLGEITGELHLALASRQEPEAFRPEPVTTGDVHRWQSKMMNHLDAVFGELRAHYQSQLSAAGLTDEELAGWQTNCQGRFADLLFLAQAGASKIRAHGDYHLGQVLKTDEGFLVIDFEGEPARTLDERRAKLCPLKDVGGMLRSFSYAAHSVLRGRRSTPVEADVMMTWQKATRDAFLEGYRATIQRGLAVFLPAAWDQSLRIIAVYELDKALYEVDYEMHNRPEWLAIPLSGIRLLFAAHATKAST